jgi:hypothetical protein
MTKNLTAICFDFSGHVRKYRIRNKVKEIESFEKYLSGYAFKYINYYDKDSKLFLYRKYLQY